MSKKATLLAALLMAVVPFAGAATLSGGTAALHPVPGSAGGARVVPTRARPAAASERLREPRLPVSYLVVDPVVSNTDRALKRNDFFPDTEPSMAVDPANPSEIALAAFSSGWGYGNGHAALFRSANGGRTWTKGYVIPRPTGRKAGDYCPCDQTFDFDRTGKLLGSFLNIAGRADDVYTGFTSNPASKHAWRWATSNGLAVKTDNPGSDFADQPWVRVAPDPTVPGQDDTYVAYGDFTLPQSIRVSVSHGLYPPLMQNTVKIAAQGCCANPGVRLAAYPATGAMYVLWQNTAHKNVDGSVYVLYTLSRSTDGGLTWSLNGSTGGLVVAAADSMQPVPKFGGVNALLGGVDAVAVDSASGAVYVVYGDRVGGKDRLASAYLTPTASGLALQSRTFVTGLVEAALPAVAVAQDGTVGVLYDTFDGHNRHGFPIFSAHLAQSTDHGQTFSDVKLLRFVSPEKHSRDLRQRVLGDYQTLRSLGNTFYGVFTANGRTLGRPYGDTDPIFVEAPAK